LSIAIACQDLKFNNIAAVIFDKDGTLENSLAYWRLVGSERARTIDAQIPGVGEPLMMAFGITESTLDPQSLMAVGSRTENEIAAAAYIAETGRSWSESRQIARSAFTEVDESKYLAKTIQSAPIYDDVLHTLKLLRSKGIKIGILSADTTAAVQEFVANHQLEDLVQLCLGTEGAITKPDPQLFWQACKALDVAPEATLMVGDASTDMTMAQAAKAAGAIAICRHQNIQLEGADIHLNSLEEIQVL